ncbi:MAG: phosphotransferase [Pseudomonadota bacterium]
MRSDIIPFLNTHGWHGADIAPLAGDASPRKYMRLSHPDHEQAVLMDANPTTGEDIGPFLHIGAHLTHIGLSAPRIYAQDTQTGLIVMEDLGDMLFDRVVAQHPDRETHLYQSAWAALRHLHTHPVPANVTEYGPDKMSDAAGLVVDWYDSTLNRTAITTEMRRCLVPIWPNRSVLVLRDYHSQNLLWLPDRAAPQNVGLLDFQDAEQGHPLYDLVSLLFDARRDVSPTTRDTILDQAAGGFNQAIAALLAQRSLRILGVFARLWLRDGKDAYLALLPRVYDQLYLALRHPSLAGLASLLANMATPTAAYQRQLRSKRP